MIHLVTACKTLQVGEVQRSVLDRLYKPAVTDNTSEDTALPGTAAESPDSMASRQVHRGRGLLEGRSKPYVDLCGAPLSTAGGVCGNLTARNSSKGLLLNLHLAHRNWVGPAVEKRVPLDMYGLPSPLPL